MASERKTIALLDAQQLQVATPIPEDRLRQMLSTLVQDTIETEFTRFLGAAPHERSSMRRGWRNGRRRRRFTTRVGTLELRVALTRKPHPMLAEWLENTGPATLSNYVLPAALRHRLNSTNSIELDHAAVRRRTRVIRIFPNEASLLRLGTALAIERNEAWCTRRYFNPDETIITLVEGRVRNRRIA